jgi:hypothetical protein
MNQQNLMPRQTQPIDRISVGQLPAGQAETNSHSVVLPSDLATRQCNEFLCSYDGDDAE